MRDVREEQYVYEDDDEIDLLEYWHIIYRHKWSILGLTAAVCVFTYVVVSAMTPIYRSAATLLIESEEANVVSIEEVYGIDASRREYYQTQFEILNSRKLSERVVDELDIASHPEYDPKQKRGNELTLASFIPFWPEAEPEADDRTPEQKRQAIINQFRSNLEIEPLRNTQLVNIHFESSDPALAPRVANAIGDAYIESYLEAQMEMTQKAAGWLTGRLQDMRQDLEQSEQELQSFQEREGLVDVEGVETLTAQELNELTRRLVEARNKTSAARSRFESIGSVEDGYNPEWETLSAVLRDSLAQQLKQDEADAQNNFSEVVERYGPKHPKFIAAQSRLDAASQAYRNRVKQVISGFEEDYQQALADQRQVERELAQAKQEIQGINRKQYELGELRREVETNQQLYDMFFKRFRETSEVNFQAANARFVDQAERTYSPVKPRKMMITGLAGVLSMMFGVMLAFLRAALDNTIKVAGEIEDKLGQSVLGVVPLETKLPKDAHVPQLYMDKGHHTFSESIRSLRTSLVLSGMDAPHKVTVVTSSIPGEGKTTIASNLALALGQMEKVLLIDADMRRPQLANEFGFKQHVTGLSELVANTSPLEDCVHTLEGMGIDMIPSGTVPPNPLDLLSSRRFVEVLEELKTKYDRIIIDSAPTQAVSDALVLSTKADALIYVVKSDATAANVVQNGIKRLLGVGAPLIGVVLNQFDAASASKYGYDGYDKYGYYAYGYASKSYDKD